LISAFTFARKAAGDADFLRGIISSLQSWQTA
jgi:hypothetical protein